MKKSDKTNGKPNTQHFHAYIPTYLADALRAEAAEKRRKNSAQLTVILSERYDRIKEK